MACRSLMCIFLSTAADAVLVGRAVAIAPFDAAAGHPHRKAGGVVVAAVGLLRRRRAAEFAAPDDQRVLQQVRAASDRASKAAIGLSMAWALVVSLSRRLLCWSQPPRPSSMNRTPASANRRASRHCRPKLSVPFSPMP